MKKLFSFLTFSFLALVLVLPSLVFAAVHSWSLRQSPLLGDNDQIFSSDSDSDGSNLILSIASGRLYTSSDSGATWTERKPAGEVDTSWSVASDGDGSNLVAGAVGSGRLYTSSNGGVDWIERRPGGTDADLSWWSVASDADGSNLIVANEAEGLTGNMYTSDDGGATWTERIPVVLFGKKWRVASDADGSNLIVAHISYGEITGGRIYTSSNGGGAWTQRNGVLGDKLWRVASDDDGTHLIAAYDNGRLYTSSDSGVNWTQRYPVFAVAQDYTSWSLSSDDNGLNYIIVANRAYDGGIFTSDDSGVTWTEELSFVTVDGSTNWTSVASDADGSNLFAGGNTPSGYFFTAPNNTNPANVSFSPTDNAIGVLTGGTFDITFDEDITVGTGNITLMDSNDVAIEEIDVVSGMVSISGSVLTVDPSVILNTDTEYYILIDATAIEDVLGNPFVGIADPTTWSFTTVIAPTFDFERVSIQSEIDGGVEGDLASDESAVASSDGRYVAFQSGATNFVSGDGDTNDETDIFVYDRTLNTIERVSIQSEIDGGVEGNGGSYRPSISSDGRYVVFDSNATNLTGVVPTAASNIFLYDRTLLTIEQVNEDGAGNQSFSNASVSDDGRYVAFEKTTSAFFTKTDVFVYDRELDTTIGISGALSSESSSNPHISKDGSAVAFISDESDLVVDDTNGSVDVFVYDMVSTEIERVSVGNGGGEGNDDSGSSFNREVSISSDGRYVAFPSRADNLVADDPNGLSMDIFVYDRTAVLNPIERIGDDVEYSNDQTISADGRYISFIRSTDSGDGDTLGLYRYDRDTDTLLYITEGSQGTSFASPSLSEDGHVLTFSSSADDLVADDTNEEGDIFVWEEVIEVEEEDEVEVEEESSRGSSGSRVRTPQTLLEQLQLQLIELLKQLLQVLLAQRS